MEKYGKRYYSSRMCTDKNNCPKSNSLSITDKGSVKNTSCCFSNNCNELKNLKVKQKSFVEKNQYIHELSVNNFTDQVLAVNRTWLVLLQVKRCESKLFDAV
jgi:hypothetical protein